jgi:hypothetical protein
MVDHTDAWMQAAPRPEAGWPELLGARGSQRYVDAGVVAVSTYAYSVTFEAITLARARQDFLARRTAALR